MLKNRWTLVVAAVVIVLAAVWLLRRGAPDAVAIDLVKEFETAEKRSNMPGEQAFGVAELIINGESHRAILAHPTSRITWKVTLPEDAWLRTSLGIDPEAWAKEGDGVLFRIGVSDGRQYEELLNQYLNPAGSSGDRRWMPVTVDLSAYSGQQVDVVFNTNSSLPGKGDHPLNDLAYWGAPAIYSQR